MIDLSLSDSAGYCAAFIGALAHGSYGVPVKATKDVDVHPLILQSYKTMMLFFMSCVVVPIVTWKVSGHATVRFTPFGILSGFLWVSGGACGIYGIRQAGMAIAVGTWASLMVCVNFTWGILIFREPVHSFLESCMAFCFLLIGLVGMSKYSAKTPADTTTKTASKTTENGDDTEILHNESSSSIPEDVASSSWEVELELRPTSKSSESGRSNSRSGSGSMSNIGSSTRSRLPNRGASTNLNGSSGKIPLDDDSDEEQDTSITTGLLKKVKTVVYGDHDDDRHKKFSFSHLNPLAIWYRCMALVPTMFAALTPRQAGIFMAAMNGILGGCSLVPLHYAKKQGFYGLTYIPSFGLGSFIANIALWSFYFCWTYYQQKQLQHDKEMQPTSNSVWKSSVDLMPSFYWSKLWKRGLLAGFLLSIGMICSILATGALGQGVGNSLVQLKILISGLWGIFYYKEIQNKRSIKLWFLSACICVSGILGLSYQRLMATQHSDEATSMAQVGAMTPVPIDVAEVQKAALLDTPVMDLPKVQASALDDASGLVNGAN